MKYYKFFEKCNKQKLLVIHADITLSIKKLKSNIYASPLRMADLELRKALVEDLIKLK